MTRMISTRLLAAIILAGTAATLAAQVPLTEDPRYRVAYSNAQLRVLHLTLPPGDTSLDQRHDFDMATISMSVATSVREQKSGQPWGNASPSRPPGSASLAEYTGKPSSLRLENVGKNPYQHFAVENLRKSGWSTAAPVTARGTTLTAESRSFRVYDVKVGGDNIQTSHKHEQPTIVISVSGAVLSEGPRERAKEFAPASVGLKQLTQPGEWLLVPAGDTHHVVSLGAGAAQLVEIEVR